MEKLTEPSKCAEIDLHIYGHFIFSNNIKAIQYRKRVLFNKWSQSNSGVKNFKPKKKLLDSVIGQNRNANAKRKRNDVTCENVVKITYSYFLMNDGDSLVSLDVFKRVMPRVYFKTSTYTEHQKFHPLW